MRHNYKLIRYDNPTDKGLSVQPVRENVRQKQASKPLKVTQR